MGDRGGKLGDGGRDHLRSVVINKCSPHFPWHPSHVRVDGQMTFLSPGNGEFAQVVSAARGGYEFVDPLDDVLR